METLGYDEPIYRLAVECEGLYMSQRSKLKNAVASNAAKMLLELHQRFATWAAFLGVFAKSSVNLDRRLRLHVEIQEQVLRLLDIMKTNLQYLFETDQPRPLSFRGPSVSNDSLEAIYGSLQRLNHLGFALRKSSLTDETVKSKKFAETLDLEYFEKLASLSLKSRYPDANEELLDQLTRSMTETYALFLHRKYRQERLQAPRTQTQTHAVPPLSTITEDLSGDHDNGTPMDVQIQRHTLAGTFINAINHQPANLPTMSQPTSVDSEKFRTMLKRRPSPSINGSTKSIVNGQVGYPQPAKGSMTCEWCFNPLPGEAFEGENWRRHINEDHEPFVCMSENCGEKLPRFASSRKWSHHMVNAHGTRWHREVYAPCTWSCPLCVLDDLTFTRPTDLVQHLDNEHQGTFTESQVRAIVRQSQIRSPRADGICPICCLFVDDQQSSLSKESVRDRRDSSHEHMPCETESESRNKRMKMTNKRENFPQSTIVDLHWDTNNREQEGEIFPPRAACLEGISTHVAAHLQSVMLLTLRLAIIAMEIDIPEDIQSASHSTDPQSLLISSATRSACGIADDIQTSSQYGEDGIDQDYEHSSQYSIPDCEYMNWQDVLHHDVSPPKDKPSPDVARPGSPLPPSIFGDPVAPPLNSLRSYNDLVLTVGAAETRKNNSPRKNVDRRPSGLRPRLNPGLGAMLASVGTMMSAIGKPSPYKAKSTSQFSISRSSENISISHTDPPPSESNAITADGPKPLVQRTLSTYGPDFDLEEASVPFRRSSI